MAYTKSTKHYHAMNGSIGCLPDNNEIHFSKESAVEGLFALFDYERGMKSALYKTGYFAFPNPQESGAEYAEVFCCHDEQCLECEEGVF